MSTATQLVLGTPVSVIWYANGEPRSIIGTVQSESPLALEVSDFMAEELSEESPLKILVQNAGVFETADSSVANVTRVGGRWRLTLSEPKWSTADRRSHKRFQAKLMARCRFVSEDPSGASIREFMVTTKDISLGGAWIASDTIIMPGSILNVELSTSPTASARALAVVAWSDPNGRGFGIEFLDLIGNSKTALTTFLKELAA